MQTNEFVYRYNNNMLPQVFIDQFQQISSINLYNIRSATTCKYGPVFVVLLLNNSALHVDRESGLTIWNDTHAWKH